MLYVPRMPTEVADKEDGLQKHDRDIGLQDSPKNISSALRKASNLPEVTNENVGIAAQFSALLDEVREAKMETEREVHNGKALQDLIRRKDEEMQRMQIKVDEAVAVKLRNGELENEILALERSLNDANAEIKSCQQVIRSRDGNISLMTKKVDDTEKTLQTTLAELAEANASLKASQQNISELEREMAIQRTELIRSSQVAAKVAASQVKSGNKDEGTVPITQHLADIKYMHGEISRLKEKVASLEKQLRVSDELKEHFKTLATNPKPFEGGESMRSSIQTLRQNQPDKKRSNPLYTDNNAEKTGIGKRPTTAPARSKQNVPSPVKGKGGEHGTQGPKTLDSKAAKAPASPSANPQQRNASVGGYNAVKPRVDTRRWSASEAGLARAAMAGTQSAGTTPEPGKKGTPNERPNSAGLHTRAWGSRASQDKDADTPKRPGSAPRVKGTSKIAAYIHSGKQNGKAETSLLDNHTPPSKASGKSGIPSPSPKSYASALSASQKSANDPEAPDTAVAAQASDDALVPEADLPPVPSNEAIALENSDEE